MRHIPVRPFHNKFEFHYNNRDNHDIFGTTIRVC